MTALTALGKMVTEKVWSEKIMSPILGKLNLRPEGYTGIHGIRIRVTKIRGWNSGQNCRWGGSRSNL